MTMPSVADPVESLVEMLLGAGQTVRESAKGERLWTAEAVLSSGVVTLNCMDQELFWGITKPAWWFLRDIAESAFEPEGLCSRKAEDLVKALNSYLENLVDGYRLAWMLGPTRRTNAPDLEAVVKAGEGLERLRKVDPLLAVVGPGIAAWYAEYEKDHGGYVLRERPARILERIESVLHLALGETQPCA
jgi:hypothetical protein